MFRWGGEEYGYLPEGRKGGYERLCAGYGQGGFPADGSRSCYTLIGPLGWCCKPQLELKMQQSSKTKAVLSVVGRIGSGWTRILCLPC